MLGTATAALWYHFPSKTDSLGGMPAEQLATADSQELAVIDRDPAVLAIALRALAAH